MILRSLWKRWWNFKMPSAPVVVVLGPTGVGKSQLAVEIALKYKGEVISADSMQLYRNLSVTTNKLTAEEMAGVPHHMIDVVDPTDSFTVVDFRNRVLPIVDNLRKSGKIPVIVGGTNYYIESILWQSLVSPDDHEETKLVSSEAFDVDPNETSESLHECLKRIDPERADKIHPNDRRKIERSLDIYFKKKRTHSAFLKEQQDAGGVLGGPLRYRDAIIFWIRSEQSVLEARLDARVDKMIERGLIKEMLDFHQLYNSTREDPDYELGVFQSIGFKEFHKYLVASEKLRESKAGRKIFASSLELMKQRTKRYSKYQNKWITKRFLGEPEREVPPLFALDSTDLEHWNENVKNVAFEIMDDYLAHGESSKHKPLEATKTKRGLIKQRLCECGAICMDEATWQVHIKSRNHKNIMQALKKQKSVEG